ASVKLARGEKIRTEEDEGRDDDVGVAIAVDIGHGRRPRVLKRRQPLHAEVLRDLYLHESFQIQVLVGHILEVNLTRAADVEGDRPEPAHGVINGGAAAGALKSGVDMWAQERGVKDDVEVVPLVGLHGN